MMNAYERTEGKEYTRMTDSRFAEWAMEYSQRTNRSLAGTGLSGAPDDRFADAAQQWGMIVGTAPRPVGIAAAAATAATAAVPVPPAADAPFAVDASAPRSRTPDARDWTGVEAIAHAERHMPVLRTLMGELCRDADFRNVRIAVCLVLEPKTAVLLRALRRAGATVGVFCDPAETDRRVADQLRAEGIAVEADAEWTPEQAHQGALRLLDEIRPHIIIDDGASFSRLAAAERPQLLGDLIGVCEETTSGVRAFQAMQDAGRLPFPVVAVNDSVLKTGFDNAHGTGESCVTTMQGILGAEAFAGSRVTVIGYGPVGRGFALRVRALGARVTVCDTDPVAALQAVFDGFAARSIDDSLENADMVVSATGVRHTVTMRHMRRMRTGAVLSVIGGIANEIALDDIPGFRHVAECCRRDIAIPDGPTLTLLAEGDGVNYTAGGGNPIEIMDLSFAVQASAVAWLLTHRDETAPGLMRLGAASDRRIAAAALAVRGFAASSAEPDNGYDWTLTRFADSAGTDQPPADRASGGQTGPDHAQEA